MASMTEPKPDEGQDEPEFKGRGIETYKRWFRNSEEAHAPARKLAHRDRDWYDNFDDDQWDETEKAILRKRGQPIVTSNRIKRKVNFLCGIEQKQRSDPRAFPRQPENEEQAAVVTDVLDYIETETRFDKVATNAFRNLCVEGIQIVEVMFDDDIECRMVDYDQYFYDPRSKDADFSDARYQGYGDWFDLEDAKEMFPSEEAQAFLDGSLTQVGNMDEGHEDKPGHHWGDATRQRVRVCCVYWKQGKVWNYTYFTGAGVLEEGVSKYLDEDGEPACALIAASCYVTRENERYGTVRDLISPQSEMNYRRSMALNLMKNRRMWGMQGVFAPDQNPKEEVARADGLLIVNGSIGKEWGFIESQSEISNNFELLQEAKSEIDVHGPNAGLQGRGTEDQSGRAIALQQNAGMAEENTLFDTHNDWKLRVYRAMWARAKQFWTEEDYLRVTDEDAPGGARFTPINSMQPVMAPVAGPDGQPMQGPDGQPQMQPQVDPMTGQPQMQMKNSLAEIDADIVLEAAPDMITLQHEEFQQLAQMADKGFPIPPDVLLEASQIKDKRKLIKRLQEEMGAQAKLQQAGQQMEEMQKAMQQMQQQMQQKPPEPTSALDQARIQDMVAKAMREERKLALEEAKAGPQMAKDRAQATATMINATKPNIPPAAPRR